jgi:endonuclease-3
MDEKEKADQILCILKDKFDIPEFASSVREPFSTLIRTVLSQASNDRNRDRAFENLSKRYPITPQTLANADVKEIEKAIQVGGLYRSKSRKIKDLSNMVLKRLNGSLDFIYSKPLKEARGLLMSMPGVGPKTADVILLFSAKRAVVPIDTHVHRVSRRLGLAPIKGDYEKIRSSLESLYPPTEYLAIHLLLISLGRTYCKARNPLHKSCPINLFCPTMQLETLQPYLHHKHGSKEFP